MFSSKAVLFIDVEEVLKSIICFLQLLKSPSVFRKVDIQNENLRLFSAGEADEMLKLVTREMRAFFELGMAPVVQFHVAAAVFPLNRLNVPSLLSGVHSQNGHLFFKGHRVMGPCFLDLGLCQKKFIRDWEAPSC